MARRAVSDDLDELSAPLRAEVRRLSTALGQVIAGSDGAELLHDVERLRRAAIAVRAARGLAAADQLASVVDLVESFEPARAEAVARAFTVYFQLVNLAEERHRVRILRERGRRAEAIPESVETTVGELSDRLGRDSVLDLLNRLELRPVLTAHPTEARRRAVVDAVRRVGRVLDELDDQRLGQAARADAERRLEEQLTILWRTAQVRQRRPSPLDEVRSVLAVFDESLFTLVPTLYRALETAVGAGRELPVILRWGSWVGGDRDGNPHVTAEVTEATLAIQSEHALLGLENASRRIGRSLTLSESSTSPSDELLEKLAPLRRSARDQSRAARGEPHRELLLFAADRLRATRLGEPGAYGAPDEFLADVEAIQRSLRAAGAEKVAGGELQHLAWQARTFGFHLASLEVRQHASVHRAVLDELAPGSPADARRLEMIAGGEERAAAPDSDAAREALATFAAMDRLQRRYGPDACRRYVVSFTRSALDVLAPLALARLAVPAGGLELDVVPLFESGLDLEAAPRVLEELTRSKAWTGWLERRGRRVEVMLGYSDATKDVGYLAANLALYRAQGELVAWARRHDIQLTIFHGRGGAIGRGGGPAGRAIRSQAPGSLGGRFKVTEQGEVIFARYGSPAIALRHLEQVTSAVLVASTAEHEAALAASDRRYAASADLMAAASREAYRQLVDTPGFAEFFAAVTPIREIGELALGSRPARRDGPPGDLEQLRAIPWVFAWAQNRCNLPGWFGLGTGLRAVIEAEGMGRLRAMLAEWPLLSSIVDNAEMSLAKADPMIAGLYLERGGRAELVDTIREEYRLTRRLVLDLTGHDRLLQGHPILRLAVDLRNPYVDALSFLQLRFLRELRDAPESDREGLADLVRLTVGGVAAGLQNTG